MNRKGAFEKKSSPSSPHVVIILFSGCAVFDPVSKTHRFKKLQVVERVEQLSLYINRVVWDNRLRPVHLALSTALCQAWISNHFQRTYHVSRRQLMQASHIQSKATYHKALRELQAFGYVEYRPSYHPVKASSVTLKLELNNTNHG
jgi:hypothetical protein